MLHLHFSPISRRQMSPLNLWVMRLAPLWQVERNPMIIFLISLNTEVCVSMLVRQLCCMATFVWQHIYPATPHPLLQLIFPLESPKQCHPSLNNIQPHIRNNLLLLFIKPSTLFCSHCGHSSPSIITHLWVRSLHHKSRLPHHASPFPSLSTHVSINSPPCSRK